MKQSLPKTRRALALLGCTLCLAACDRQAAPPPAPPPPEVATLTVSTQPLLLTTELPGRTSPYLIAEVRPQINGLVQKRLFTEGADVQAGDELYQIDPAQAQAALDNAKAGLARSKANLPALRSRADRVQDALADKAVSQQDFDDADAALKQGEADVRFWEAMLQTATLNLGYTRIASPISGRIGKSTVTDGAIVTAYQPSPLATIQQLDPIYVDVPQSTAELLRLRNGRDNLKRDGADMARVSLLLGDGTPYPQEGTLQFQDVSVDPSTGSVILRMVFPNPDKTLLPGMFVRAVVKEGVREQAILIPQQAVSRDPKGNPLALVVGAENKVESRPLVLDRAVGTQWLVASGLQPGDKVIVEGALKARPGTPVRDVPFGAPAQPAPPPAPAPAEASK